MKIFYLILAVLGLILPGYYILGFLSQGSLADYMTALSSGDAMKSIVWDLLITFFAAYGWMVYESRRLKMSNSWLFLILPFCSPFAFAFPLFLYARVKHLEPGDR